MKKTIRKAAVCICACVFLGSSAMVGYQHYQYRLGETIYNEAEALAGVPDLDAIEVAQKAPASVLTRIEEPQVPAAQIPAEQEETPEEATETVWTDPYADALAAMDFAALQEVNSEVLGWILISGTGISYPLLQAEDNEKYLNTTWRGSRSSVGAIFMECRNSADLSDDNTIIYGHRLRNGAMFGSLKNYANQSYWIQHPDIYITDEEGCKTYTIFAAYEAGVSDETFRLSFTKEGTKQEFLDFCTAQSVIETGIEPTENDRILTLSTCTGRGYETRWVVQAVLR